MKKRELRAVFNAQIRAKQDAEKPTIEGYAAVFNVETEIYSWSGYSFRELIKPGAFKRTLAEGADVRCLFNHDSDKVLGRSTAKTLELKEDEKGLYFQCELPDTQLARDLHALIKRGDVNECSFGFYVVEQEWKEKKDGDVTIETRTLIDVDLIDVSPVTFPAYPQTSVTSREGIPAGALARSLWPDGIPAEVRQAIDKRKEQRNDECMCDCAECEDGDCSECTNAECEDENCRCMNRSAAIVLDQFAYVGDPKDSRTWKLPTSATAIRNSIARFNEIKSVPEDKKPAAWEKLVAAAKQHELKVTEEDRTKWKLTDEQFKALTTRSTDPDGDGDDDTEIVNALNDASALAQTYGGTASDAATKFDKAALQLAVDDGKALIASVQKAVDMAETELSEDEEESNSALTDFDRAVLQMKAVRASL